MSLKEKVQTLVFGRSDRQIRDVVFLSSTRSGGGKGSHICFFVSRETIKDNSAEIIGTSNTQLSSNTV